MARKKITTLNELYDEVARRADTQGLKINAADTRRVIATLFDVLEDVSPRQAVCLLARALGRAGQRRR